MPLRVAWFVVPVLVLLTTALSGALGMGGGLLLMGVLLVVLPPAEALALHGVVQLTANAQRAVLHRGHIAWRLLGAYFAASAVAVAVLSRLRVLIDRDSMFVLLGVVALGGALLGTRRRVARALSIDRRSGSACCGLLVTASNLTAGVGGPLLDVFFLGSGLNRRAVVASKACTQTFSHALKIGYVAMLRPEALGGTAFSPALLAVSLVAAGCGTWLGGRVLEKLSERGFRNATRALVATLGVVYLARGVFIAGN